MIRPHSFKDVQDYPGKQCEKVCYLVYNIVLNLNKFVLIIIIVHIKSTSNLCDKIPTIISKDCLTNNLSFKGQIVPNVFIKIRHNFLFHNTYNACNNCLYCFFGLTQIKVVIMCVIGFVITCVVNHFLCLLRCGMFVRWNQKHISEYSINNNSTYLINSRLM